MEKVTFRNPWTVSLLLFVSYRPVSRRKYVSLMVKDMWGQPSMNSKAVGVWFRRTDYNSLLKYLPSWKGKRSPSLCSQDYNWVRVFVHLVTCLQPLAVSSRRSHEPSCCNSLSSLVSLLGHRAGLYLTVRYNWHTINDMFKVFNFVSWRMSMDVNTHIHHPQIP